MQNTTWVNSLKLRASYGTTGNQRIVDTFAGPFAAFGGADLTRDLYATGGQYGGINGLTFSQIGNNDLKWETVVQTNIGLDFGFFDRLRGSFDVYKKNTIDLYIGTPISPALNGGIQEINANVGELQNTGFDIELDYDLFKANSSDDLGLTFKLAANYNKQEILDLGPSGDIPYEYRVGGVIAEIYAAPFVGVNPANGNLLFQDKDGNITEDLIESDQVATGMNYFPDYQGSVGFDADFKNFFLTTQFNFVTGVDRYDFDYSGFMDPTAIGQFRHSRDILHAWKQPGDITFVPSLTATNLSDDGLSDRHIREADYLRLRFVQLGYNFPQNMLEKIGFSQGRAFVNAENLVTFSKWKGLDAEGFANVENDYPTPKTISVGVELGF